jgi:hypothetical protein
VSAGPTNTPMLQPAYHVKDVAGRSCVTVGRVLSWIKSGKLRALDVSEGDGKRARWRITPEALAEFEATRTFTPAPRTRRRRSASGWQFQYF